MSDYFAAPFSDEDRVLLETVHELADLPRLSDLDADRLQSLTREQRIDFATALFYDRIVNSEEHGPFIREIQSLAQAATPPSLNPLHPGAVDCGDGMG
jgi:hypothetical protein